MTTYIPVYMYNIGDTLGKAFFLIFREHISKCTLYRT